MTHFVFFAFIALIALQFSDAFGQYKVYTQSLAEATKLVQWVVGKIGLAPTIVTTKVVIIAVVTALYFLTSLPLWLWLAAVLYYLYRTGKMAVVYGMIKAAVDG